MAKEIEKIASIITENDFKPDLEIEVKYHLSKIPEQKKNTIKYKRVEYPTFRDKREEFLYQVEEFRRCREGYNGMSPKMYFWFNYCCLRDPELGKIRPEYRTITRDWFDFIEEHQSRPDKRGIIAIKRRRVGASWMSAADALHDCLFTQSAMIGMSSKSEKDSRDLFKHIKYIYQNLPSWMRPLAAASDRRDYMEFSYHWDIDRNKVVSQKGLNTEKRGTQNWIVSLPPTDSGHEGAAYSKLVIDEAGKIPNLLTIWGYAQDCLMKPPRVVGQSLIFGTVGNIDGSGSGIKEMWEKSEEYRFDKFFFGGYNAMDGMIDEYGNDLTEHAVRYIIYERDRLKQSAKQLSNFRQKYPLNDVDAFNLNTDGGVGNIILINEQITKLNINPPETRVGWMRRNPDGGVDFVPNPSGKVIVYELPDHSRVNGYVAGSDPADADDSKKSKDNSNLALTIVAKPFGTDSPKLVLEYVDRPAKLDSFFEQSAMCLEWYNNTKVLIEDNRARMVNYFQTNYPKLLPLVPKSIATAKQGVEMKNSVRMTEERKQQMMGLMEDYIDKYCEFIPSISLLEEHKVFGDAHSDDDRAIAWGWSLVMLQADKRAVQHASDTLSNRPQAHFQRVGNLIQLVNTKGEPIRRLTLPKNPLFNR
jgi:hypothetical protein